EADVARASYAADDLTTLLGYERVFFYPATYRGAGLSKRIDESYRVQRTAALQEVMRCLQKPDDLVLVSYPQALEEGIPSALALAENSLFIHTGDRLSHDFIKECLFSQGFSKVDFVSEPGQFAIRGSIIDVFSYGENRPYRINFFGDEVENLRLFDYNTQQSIEQRQSINIISCMEGVESLGDTLGSGAVIWNNGVSLQGLFSGLPEFITGGFEKTERKVVYETVPQPVFNKNFEWLVQDITQKKALGYRVCILSENTAQINRLDEIFESQGCRKPFVEYITASLHEGFVDHENKVCLYTDHQLFERQHRVKLRRSVEKSEQLTINDLSGFRIGDYVVHIDHGVGIFGGLVKADINGKPQEVIKLIYRDNDVLFVNIHGLHRISRYKSHEGSAPKIYKLGSGAWSRLKQQTKNKVKDIARDLIKLYSQRYATKGFAFTPDTYLQHELEASFIYEDTPDQLKATQDVKQDMEQPHPMDRLICGDVGFGKTEVAIRAAFKAVTDGKQVAVLVPTTILALQHYQTFSERLANFPVTVSFISRLKTAGEIKEILAHLEEGKVDIIIGTHRLLNSDIKFKDLGLLIIDEEQKFGVAAKEKLRQLKLNVDTLTMTATPIPRTLQFSLMGARDLSIIQTPPPNRLPIQTEVQLFDEDLIKEAIALELERGGQLFFVHNRVEDILSVADILQRIWPGLRIGIGHGQMAPKVLEKVLLDFICGDYDLLLATSIIENGIDIPNANTIIINRAHTFGLSDLHQMRGRVGRSNRKAYCYLLVPQNITLTEDAKRRLSALEAFTELGSGFNIAMQDLDIRGAGNLLGGEQSGYIAEMGFEAYQRILEEALAEMNENTVGPEKEYISDCTIETDLEVMIPDDYISQVPEKIRLYKELDNMREEDQLQRFFAGLEDRFGPVPDPLKQLGYVVRLRRIAIKLGFERIVLKNGIMLAYFINNPQSSYYKSTLFAEILNYISSNPRHFLVKEHNNKLFVKVSQVNSVEAAYNLLKIFAKH
ncbi:MAG TPA: transcription-repair coupling factor, partial [Bacteroidales bacterium]|nr:transcription-repair coupling factor [Bacteroidales bacterium]